MGKKTSARKKTDEVKPWNKRTSSGRYKIASRDPKITILIVCEGQTEKLYFESFPTTTVEVTCIDMGGQSKVKLVEECIKREKAYRKERTKYDEVWCVFDMDVKAGAKEFSDFDTSIQMAKKKGFKVAYSNDAFELWYYLHYQYTDQPHHRKFYYDELTKRWGFNYEKEGKKKANCTVVYKRLNKDTNENQASAIARAEKLYEAQKHLPPSQQNPVTKVYELVRILEGIKKA